MTSSEIQNWTQGYIKRAEDLNEPIPEPDWLREIAYQLAVLNERVGGIAWNMAKGGDPR
jgi:hypothetical protein